MHGTSVWVHAKESGGNAIMGNSLCDGRKISLYFMGKYMKE
jgi:hypothetical protein